MDDAFGFILFAVIFILAPLIEQMRKKNQPPKQPPQRVPPRAQPRPLPRSSTEELAPKRQTAATMVPDDLWQVLTGEARPPVSGPVKTTASPPVKNRPWDVVYIPPEEVEDEEAELEDVRAEIDRPSREVARREPEGRYRPVEAVSLEVTQANIVSLETPVAASSVRHAAFHEKVDAKPVVVAERLPKFGLASRSQLRRAFVLQEIIGKPRGLEEGP